jgi:uncharacterized LabA/DUF88 family protein
MVKKVLAFVDGENLVFRYQAMVNNSRMPHADVVHVKDAFVWSPRVTLWSEMDLFRVTYYTSVVGNQEKVDEIERRISSTKFECKMAGYTGTAQIIPRVHKKPANSNKTKVVDVDITMDVMRAALETPVDAIYLLTGDGDYLPLVREITRRTSKQVYLGAFSSGLAKCLPTSVEAFNDLDPWFFDPKPG